jgi:flavodoxin
LKEKLENKGMKVLGGFSCKAWDTYGPFKLMGGINKGRPNEEDLKKAREFAKGLLRP